jgi:DNA-binding FadR family transcriptional regulator
VKIPQPDTVKNQNRGDEIVVLLKKKIIFREYLPGDAFPREELLAQQYSVSRGLIREALGILKAQGYLESRRGKGGGTFVKNVLESDEIDNLYGDLVLMGQMKVRDLLAARLLIEPEAARSAALNATAAELQDLSDCLDAATESSTLEERININIKFHNAIGQISGNPFYAISIRSFMKFTHMFIKTVGEMMPDVHNDDDHREILYALQAKDGQLAYERMYVHDSATKNSMMVLEKMFREIRYKPDRNDVDTSSEL